jgi:DNA-binding CsgD family transcriptional regulator
VPTIVFHSRDDARVPFDQGRRMAALIPHARFIPLQSKNHILLEQEPAWDVFREEFRRFVSEKPPAVAQVASIGRLSAREREVLALVARGRTDREIAVALSLSARTVSNHVQNILHKLDAPNRAAAAALAAKLDLI